MNHGGFFLIPRRLPGDCIRADRRFNRPATKLNPMARVQFQSVMTGKQRPGNGGRVKPLRNICGIAGRSGRKSCGKAIAAPSILLVILSEIRQNEYFQNIFGIIFSSIYNSTGGI
jgi:hypothetical protein